jgi:hypothetical protein
LWGRTTPSLLSIAKTSATNNGSPPGAGPDAARRMLTTFPGEVAPVGNPYNGVLNRLDGKQNNFAISEA